MTKKVRDSKRQLNKEHSALLEAFQTISDSGLVKYIASVLVACALLIWRVEMLSMKVSDVAIDVKSHDDTLEVYRPLVWNRPASVRDTTHDTLSHTIVEFIPKRPAEELRLSPFGGPATDEEKY